MDIESVGVPFALQACRRGGAGDSHVLVRWRSRGTHLGPLGDIPATGRKVSNHGCTVMEVRNSKAAHTWVYFDNAHLLRQIGVLPGGGG
jgi:predicted ester cyclase